MIACLFKVNELIGEAQGALSLFKERRNLEKLLTARRFVTVFAAKEG